MKQKLILTDCDGVLLNWSTAFEEWMQERGYYLTPGYDETIYGKQFHFGLPHDESEKLIKEFNHSARIGFLEPFRDAVEYVDRLYMKGYKFGVITSFTKDKYAILLRRNNLEQYFSVAS